MDPGNVRRRTVVGSEKMVVYDDVSENKIAVYDKGIDIMAKLGQHMDYDSGESVDLDLLRKGVPPNQDAVLLQVVVLAK